MHINVFKPKICEFVENLTKYAKLYNKKIVFELYVLYG